MAIENGPPQEFLIFFKEETEQNNALKSILLNAYNIGPKKLALVMDELPKFYGLTLSEIADIAKNIKKQRRSNIEDIYNITALNLFHRSIGIPEPHKRNNYKNQPHTVVNEEFLTALVEPHSEKPDLQNLCLQPFIKANCR